MNLPPPRARLAGCVWLSRLLAKARLAARNELPPEYAARFCHPTGVDGEFLAFFGLTRGQIETMAATGDDEAARVFLGLPSADEVHIAEWNRLAVNFGRPGYPMADRFPIAMATTYRHLAHLQPATVFAALEADEREQ